MIWQQYVELGGYCTLTILLYVFYGVPAYEALRDARERHRDARKWLKEYRRQQEEK